MNIHIYGVAPVQADGSVGEKPLYFRARGNSWSVTIGDWAYKEKYSNEPFDAGYMEPYEALQLISKAIIKYVNEQTW